ncbi:MAG TPA: protein kinase [Polyangiaceae bacterium]|nr:protein kinase [Polyangiaceae bacterium]
MEAERQRDRQTAQGVLGAAPAESQPTRIGPYDIVGLLGEGGVGVVYRARHQTTGQSVALKTVRVRATAHLSSVRREILALHRLKHPGIVRFCDGGVFEGRPWYAMELLDGCTLLQTIGGSQADYSTIPSLAYASPPRSERRSSPPPRLQRPAAGGHLEELLTLFRLLCAPLAYLHGEGIVHRDIKPSNVFIRPDGTPVLMDFGLVGRWRGALGREILEDTQTFGGTLVYMAPEQIRGELGDARSDLYALGCTLYEALTGMVPFEDFGSSGLGVREVGPVPPSEIVAGIPSGLDELVLQLLEKDPRDRIGHADDVAQALAALGARDWPREGLPRGRAYLYQPRLVGRVEALRTMLEGVDSSRKLGGLLLLGGESGIGKTSLAAEVARLAYQREYEVVTSECRAVEPGRAERSSPLAAFRPLLRHIVEHCLVGGAAVVDRVVGPWHRVLAGIEPAFLQLSPTREAVDPAGLPVQAALERMLGALSETILAFARESNALLLVIDDLQWADGLSLALLARIGTVETEQAAGRLVLLGTYRTEEAGAWLLSLLELPRTLHVELDRLGPSDVGKMVADMLGVVDAPADLARFVAEESEGNPFFVGEYLRTALDAGLLCRDAEGRWHKDDRSPKAALSLPNTVRALVERRLGVLSDGGRRLVEVAAVIGHDIEPELLLSLGEQRFTFSAPSERDLLAQLGDLNARHVLVETTRETLAFSHDTLRRVAYERIAPDERRALHGLVAEALETRSSRFGQPERAPLLAYHYEQAGDAQRALDYLERAGLDALSHSAGKEAASFFREALRLDAEAGLGAPALRRARWESHAGNALQAVGDLEAGKRHLERAAALFGSKRSRSPAGLVLDITRELVTQLAHRVRAPKPPPAAQSLELLDAARTHDHLLQIHYYEAAALPLAHASLRTLNLAERAGPSPELASAYANAFAALALSPAMRRFASHYLHRAEETLAAAPDAAVESYLLLLKGLDLANQGRFREGEPVLREVVAIAERLGYRRRWEEAVSILAYNHGMRGLTREALDQAESVYRSSLRGDPQTRCWSLIERARGKLALSDVEEACRDLDTAAALAEGLGRDERVWVAGLQALAELEAGDAPRAAVLADRTLVAIGRRVPLVSAAGAGHAALAEACLKLAERAEASARAERLSIADRACRSLRRFALTFPLMAAHADFAEAELLRLRGKAARARSFFARAVESAERADIGPLASRARAQALLVVS